MGVNWSDLPERVELWGIEGGRVRRLLRKYLYQFLGGNGKEINIIKQTIGGMPCGVVRGKQKGGGKRRGKVQNK